MTKQKRKLINVVTHFSQQSLSTQVIYFEMTLIILIGLTIFFVYTKTTEQIYEQNKRYLNYVTSQMISNMNTHLASTQNIMYNTTYNRAVHDLLTSKTPLEIYENTKKMDDYMVQIGSQKEEIKKMVIMGDGDAGYNMGYNSSISSQLKELRKNVGSSTKIQYIGTIQIEDKSHIVFGNSIYSLNKAFARIGELLVILDGNLFSKELESEFGEFYIVDDKGRIIAGVDEDKIGTFIESEKLEFTNDKWYVKDMPVTLVGMNTKENIDIGIKSLWFLYRLIIMVMIIMVVCTYVFVRRYAVKPLTEVNKFINVISRGDLRYLKKRIKIKNGSKEIRSIAVEINELLDEVNHLSVRLVTTTSHLYDIELSKKKAELSFLKSQINPHFLYNTLGVIKGIAMLRQEKEIELISGSLVKIFRYSIKGKDEVELMQEIDVVKAYIGIQQCRFRDRFDVVYKIEDHLMELKIQKMILQPIVENAISYGIEPLEQRSTIEIIANEEEEYIKLIIKDNGVGISAHRLRKIQEQLVCEYDTEWEEEHLGILNVHRRLIHAYGKMAKVMIQSEEGKGTTVSLCIPSDKV